MRTLHVKLHHSRLKALFKMYDEDGNGMIDHHEFCSTICPRQDEAAAEAACPGSN